MLVIDRLPEVADPSVLAGKARDTVRLTWEGRRSARKRLKTTGGREIALALPADIVLAIGSILCVEPDRYLIVEGAPEPVIAVAPRSQAEALRIAFEAGNRHSSVSLLGDLLLVPDDIAMVQLLDRLHAPWECVEAVYTPIGFGTGQVHDDEGDGHGRHQAGPQAYARA